MLYPKVFEDLIQDFKMFPGIGEKSAERFAYIVDSLSPEDVKRFSENLNSFKTKIKKCKTCGIIT